MNRVELDDAAWFTSSYSNGNGECVEVAFFRSSYSNGNGSCVEVAHLDSAVAVRDSKQTAGAVLTSTVGGWQAFVSAVVGDEFGRS